MQGTIAGRDLLQPRSLTDALKMLRNEGPLVPMAGCTDLYVSLNFGTLRPTRFLNLWNLDTLRGIEARGATLRIGALATYTDIITSGLIRRRLPMLAAAAREVGGVQIQNRGTIGGNVANASPAGDTLPVLLAVDASSCCEACRDAARADDFVLHRLPSDSRAPRRTDRGLRDSRCWWAPVVPEGRHAGRAGDREDRRRRSLEYETASGHGQCRADRAQTDADRRSAWQRRVAGRCSGHPADRDHADRRRAIDGGVSPSGRRKSARGILTRDKSPIITSASLMTIRHRECAYAA